MKYRIQILSVILSACIFLLGLITLSISRPQYQIEPQEIIEKIKAFDSKLKGFKADFQEIRQFAFDPEKEVMSGKVYFSKPSQIRRDYLSPNTREEVLTKKKAWIYLPNIKQVQLINFKGKTKLASLPIGLKGPSKDFEKKYHIKISKANEKQGKSLYLMELTPREGTEASVYYSYINLWLREGRWIPAEKSELKEITGDIIIIQLSNIEINPKLSSKLFKYSFPADVEVIDYTSQK